MTSLKILVGVAGIATAGTAMYSFGMFESDSVSQNNKNEKFLLGNISDANSENIKNTNLSHEKDKNYVCTIDTDEINDCQLYVLNTSESKNQKLTNASDIVNNKKIVISYPEKEESKIVDTKNISIYKKDKKTLLFNISIPAVAKQKTDGFLSQTIIAKVKTVNSSSKDLGDSNFKCKLADKNEKINCEIFKLSNTFESTENNLPFDSSLSIEKQIEFKDEITEGSFVIIKTTENDLYSKNWKTSNPIIYLNSSTGTDEQNQFIEIEYFATLSDDLPTITESQYDYVVVSASTITPAVSAGSPTATTPEFSGDNYKCIVPISATDNLSDETCVIYKFSDDDSSNASKIDLNKITNSPNQQKMTSVPTASKNYVLKIKRNRLSKLGTAPNTKITLVNKTNPENKYIDLSLKNKLTNSNEEFKTNLLLVKVTKKTGDEPTTAENNYKCKFKSDQTEKIDCKVYSFSTNPTINATSDITESNMQKLTTTTKNQSAQNNYLIIEIQGENNKFTEKELRGFLPEVYLPANNGALFLNTEYTYSYVGNIVDSSPQTAELFRIKNSSEDYLVVKHESTGTPAADSEFNSSGTKNYRCKFTVNGIDLIDDTCVLKIIDGPEANKAIKYDKITTPSSTAITKSAFTTNKFFKLIINNPKILSQVNSESIINIESNANPQTNAFGTVKVISKTFNYKRTAKTNFYLVKAKDPVNTADLNLTNTKCKLFNETTSETCTIYKFQATEATDYKDLNFTQSNTVAQKSEINTTNHYVVKFSNKEHQLPNINVEDQILTLNASGGEKIVDFKIISPFYSSNAEQTSGTIVLLK